MSETEYVLVPKVPTEAMIDAAVGLTGDGRGITAQAYSRMISASPAPAASRRMPVRYVRSQGSTLAEMQAFIQRHPLHSMGDAVLCWVNEGDLYGGSAKRVAALPDAPVPAKDGEGEG